MDISFGKFDDLFGLVFRITYLTINFTQSLKISAICFFNVKLIVKNKGYCSVNHLRPNKIDNLFIIHHPSLFEPPSSRFLFWYIKIKWDQHAFEQQIIQIIKPCKITLHVFFVAGVIILYSYIIYHECSIFLQSTLYSYHLRFTLSHI